MLNSTAAQFDVGWDGQYAVIEPRKTPSGDTSGKNKTVCHLTLFFSIEGQDCEQQLSFTYDTETNTSLEANLTDIIESISLE